MKINLSQKDNLRAYSELCYGDVFWYSGHYWVKAVFQDVDRWCAVDLETGVIREFGMGDLVEPIELECTLC